MIFVTGIIMMTLALVVRVALTVMGRFSHYRYAHTDWLFVLPFWGGAGCVVWSIGALAWRWLP